MIKKYSVLYDWTLSALEHLSGSPTAIDFAGTLVNGNLDTFTTVAEQIGNHAADMRKAHVAREMFAQWPELLELVARFERDFGAFPGLQATKLRVSLLLGGKLAEVAAQLDDDDVDPDVFEWRPLDGDVALVWFAHQNARSLENSLILMDLSDTSALAAEMAATPMSPLLLFPCMAAWHQFNGQTAGRVALVRREADPIPNRAVTAFAKLVVLASGKPIHQPRQYTALPSVLDVDAITPGEKYQQFNDLLDVLSEYNSREELLTKYLTLYHVVENFMVRLPIVRLERENSGRMFSIRDFRQLYHQIDVNESAALRSMCEEVLALEATPGTSFRNHVQATWTALVGTSQAELDAALSRLGLRTKAGRPVQCDDFVSQFDHQFAKLVYAVRNAIVHNRETEFHLTFATLDAPLRLLMEQFLIPSLEQLCFALVTSSNKHVWYSNCDLALYKE